MPDCLVKLKALLLINYKVVPIWPSLKVKTVLAKGLQVPQTNVALVQSNQKWSCVIARGGPCHITHNNTAELGGRGWVASEKKKKFKKKKVSISWHNHVTRLHLSGSRSTNLLKLRR